MSGSIRNFIVINRIIFWVLIVAYTSPFPLVWGSPYLSAEHYWPMHNITNGILEDVRGAAHTVVHEGKIVIVPQLGYALSLDGKDDWVDTGGFNADCVTEPSRCENGFTMSFWLKVHGTGYILSSGSFTNKRNGPGYQLYYHQSLKRFKFLLETRDKKWTLFIHEEVGLWTHMAFTWRERNGLSYYEDGNLSSFTDKPEIVSALRQQNYTPVITLARPSSSLDLKKFGKFEISQFAIWQKELSAADIAGVYGDGLSYNSNFAMCCHFKSVSPCMKNPCHDPEHCRRIMESAERKCICPSVNLRLKTCKAKITGECEDKSTSCAVFASQSEYCKRRKMREICPRSCNYCAPARPFTTLKPTLETSSTFMSRISRKSRNPSTVIPTNGGPTGSGLTTNPTRTPTTARRGKRGESCDGLTCEYHERCVNTSHGYVECKCPQHTCHNARKIICGTDGKTYLNMCVLRKEICRVKQQIKKKHDGRCSGELFPSATHYWPLNKVSQEKKVNDLRGNSNGNVYNGVKQSTADQIGGVLTLDGKDAFIELSGFKEECIVDPSSCSEGLSVAFWIKYIKGEFILSSGHYTSSSVGPGYRFVCENCGPHLTSSGRFILELSNHSHKWRILLDSLPKWWFHFAFTWSRMHGLKFYKNGRLAVKSKKPDFIRNGGKATNKISIGKPNSLNSIFMPNKHGEFSIGHFAIWIYELSWDNVELAFLSSLTKTTSSIKCCHSMKADPCVKNPCHNGATCQRLENRYKCICEVNNLNRNCEHAPVPCEDAIDNCDRFVQQDGYCKSHKRRMWSICPKACNFCLGGSEKAIRSTQVSASASFKTNVRLTETTPRSQIVGETLQSENRSAQSTREGGEISITSKVAYTKHGSKMASMLSSKPVEASDMKDNSRSRSGYEMIGTFDKRVIISTKIPSLFSDFTPKGSTTRTHSMSTAIRPHKTSQLSSASSSRTTVIKESLSITSVTAFQDSESFSSTAISKVSSSISLKKSTGDESYAKHTSTSGHVKYTNTPSSTETPVNSIKTTSIISLPVATGHFSFTLAQTLLSSTVAVQEKAPLTCNINNVTCVCFNCGQVRPKGGICCMDHVDNTKTQQGVVINMINITVESFYPKVNVVAKVIEGVIWDSCMTNSSLCLGEENVLEAIRVRKKRSAQSFFFNDDFLLDILRIKRDSESGHHSSQFRASPVNEGALRPDIKPSNINITRVHVIIYGIYSKAGTPSAVGTAFYVTVTSLSNGTNHTQVLDGKGLLQILRDKRNVLENKLNITIDSFSAALPSESLTPSSALMPNPSAPSKNLQTPLASPEVPTSAVQGSTDGDDSKGISQGMLILIISAAIGGLVLLVVLSVFIFTRFYRQRKGEFVPDKNYPNPHSKQNSEAPGVDDDVDNIASFNDVIDPSTPRITDVPHKPTRTQSSSGGGPGSVKKPKKPMGVKVTYKPPKWD
ncbi:uncharacterized protein LOC111334546 isoform X2 [Stylophora pistillata]|uniref:uncharacterized protein LOC111334546 isoform X2 n=1 Tax=Stylophora pistillata TaxID=50429 RepID=UPI000C057158|nr:uncharacterized protein LOC111334546 isoform X2 [Stylophora pistillata]